MDLPPTQKCLVKYVRDKCAMSGVWQPNWKLASVQIGDTVDEAMLLAIDNGRQFAITDQGKVYCDGFYQFQYGADLNPKSPVHKKVIDSLEKVTIQNNRVLNTLPDRVSNTPQEEEEDKEEDKDKVKDKEPYVFGRFPDTPVWWAKTVMDFLQDAKHTKVFVNGNHTYAEVAGIKLDFAVKQDVDGWKELSGLKRHFTNYYNKYHKNKVSQSYKPKSFIEAPGGIDYESPEFN